MNAAAPIRVFGLIPAAGSSRRMGAAKQLLPWGNSNVVKSVVDAVAAGGLQGLVLVTTPQVSAALGSAYTTQHNVVVLDDPAAEMIDSIIAGVLALRTVYAPSDGDAFLVCPGDLPRMSADLVSRCRATYAANVGRIIAPSAEGRPRHPLVVPFALADELAALHGVGLQGLLARHADGIVTVPLANADVVRDVDTPEDYAALRDRSN